MISELENLLASFLFIKRMWRGGFVTICLLSTFYCLLAYSYPSGWSDDIMISNDTIRIQDSPDIDVDSHNNVWVCWLHVASAMACEIYYTKRDSLGNCLIPATNISNNPTNSGLAEVVVDNWDNIHIVWCDQLPQGMWHAKLANDGSVLVPAHPAAIGAGSGTDPEIAMNKYQEVNIAWDENPTGNDRLTYTKLDTLGNPIIEKIWITPDAIDALWSGIGVDSFANNHIVYRSDTAGTPYRFTYTKLDKDGNSLIYGKVLGSGGQGSIVSDRHQNIHIIYDAIGNRTTYLKLDQNGNVLIGPMTISPTGIWSNTYSHLAIDSLQYLHVVWTADSMTVFHIMYCKMDTSGNFIIPPMKIVHPPYTEGAGEPRIAVDRSNRLHVVWMDRRLDTDIFYKRGENELVGIETQKLKRVSLPPKISVFPNPFYSETKIQFSVSRKTGKVKLEIYNVAGRKVKEFVLDKPEGIITWQGDDDSGRNLTAGVYFIAWQSSEKYVVNKVIFLK